MQGTWRGLEVAIKRVILQVLGEAGSQEKLRTALREAAINSALNHPNVVSTYTYNMQRMGEMQVGLDAAVNLPCSCTYLHPYPSCPKQSLWGASFSFPSAESLPSFLTPFYPLPSSLSPFSRVVTASWTGR